MADPALNPLPPEQGPPPSPAVTPQHRNKVFFGPNGLRAGWRALLFLMIVVGLFLWLLVAARFFLRRSPELGNVSQLTPLGLGISEFAIFALTSIAALIMSRMEHRKYGDYGLPIRLALRKNFWLGVLIGFLSISTCLLAIFAFHGFRLTGLAIHGRLILWATAAWGLAFIIVGLAEEFTFRGYMQYTLSTGMGFWPSAVLLSALFALAHSGNPGESRFGLLSVVFFALLFCLFLRRTGNLWLAVGFHAGWDWGQTFFYGVRDSGIAPYHNLLNSEFHGSHWITGGTVGPEASIFTPIVLVIVGIVFARICRENLYVASRESALSATS
jgi:membrane protease YdiL (CAAX protease family)